MADSAAGMGAAQFRGQYVGGEHFMTVSRRPSKVL